MRRPPSTRRMPQHHLLLHRRIPHRAHGAEPRPLRNSDLVLALLGLVLLGGLALAAGIALAAGAAAP